MQAFGFGHFCPESNSNSIDAKPRRTNAWPPALPLSETSMANGWEEEKATSAAAAANASSAFPLFLNGGVATMLLPCERQSRARAKSIFRPIGEGARVARKLIVRFRTVAVREWTA